MFHIRMVSPASSTPGILEFLADCTGAINVTVLPGSARFPDGDVVDCYLTPEVAGEMVHRLEQLGPRQRGTLTVEKLETAVIRSHREMVKPMVSDREIAPVWEVVDATIRANATYPFSFYLLLVCAGLIATVGILTNSQILIVAAMVVGPEYNAILGAALGITERSARPVKRGTVALVVGFAMAIAASLLFGLAIRGTVGAPHQYMLGLRPVANLISKPDLYSVVVAVVAGIVGVVSILQARASALIGVFISVTTIPAAAYMGLSASFGQWGETKGAAEQLLLNVGILLVVGVVTLILQRRFWNSRETRQRLAGSSAGDLPASP
jgi:uncharacterized hydrophobic protein (TIGR00271 family)